MLNHLSAVFAAIMPFSAVAAGQGTEVSLALTSRGAYVIGEPVILAGSLKNVGTDAFREYRADRPRHAEALEIFISEDGVEFAEYRMGIWGTAKVERSLESLHPNEAWTFELRVLYTYKRASRLAFERPGKYFIKVAYPLIRARQRVESNIVAIEINPPRGVDARVWREIRKPEFLYFLQSGHVQDPDRDVVPRAIELLRPGGTGGPGGTGILPVLSRGTGARASATHRLLRSALRTLPSTPPSTPPHCAIRGGRGCRARRARSRPRRSGHAARPR